MPRTSDEMKEWSAMLEHELRGWPHIMTKPMFGLLGFYRKKTIFAALPVTRGIGAPNSIIFKMKSMPPDLLRRVNEDSRMSTGTRMRAKGWHSFDVFGGRLTALVVAEPGARTSENDRMRGAWRDRNE